ncbi:type II toxin-antitoxin system PemK/MazF family toxin [Chamaesiphon sp. VAR_48_metabat_135_sub]|uniref:type II toxin-antitoxin system PemK/MazF family toxin n=1 Tax=Chamaesiphon sp. VAR_48_metabat_135_sub TaxID=2964699 RepID=UPI00286AE28A|nr:type II toxin-antitoxin system PemK/MazF family toxin [Chamaesiphon sp. VAR_48_metabat_135_sub]
MTNSVSPQRGEVWLVNFDPTLGTEIQKIRPAVVISSNEIGVLPIKLVAPITDWKDRYFRNLWHVRIDPTVDNGLSKSSSVDTLQLRGVDTQRFIKKLGVLSSDEIAVITIAIVTVIEAEI